MKKTFLLSSIMLTITVSVLAQTWEQLPYYYPRSTQGKARIFSAANDKLVAGYSFEASPASHVSTDGGATWQQAFADKPITSVGFGPDGTYYFIASKRYMTTANYYMDTLFTSADGATWTNAGYKLTGGNGLYTEYNFAITADNKLLFPNFMDASGVYLSKSGDNGASWAATAVKAGPVTCSPSGDTIVISTDSPWPGGVIYSHDGGATVHDATWASGAPGGSIPVRTPNGDIYAASAGAIYKSTDGGMSFGTNLLSGPIGSIQEFVYAANGKFYIRVTGSVKGIWETTDFVTMTGITATIPDYDLISDMAVSDNYVYAVADTNLYRYAIGGSTSVAAQASVKPMVSVYPNPVSDVLHIAAEGNISLSRVELTDVFGRVVARATDNEKVLQLQQLPAGIYYLKVMAGSAAQVEKIIVAR